MIKVTKKLVEARHHAAMVGPDVELSDIVAHDHQNVRFFRSCSLRVGDRTADREKVETAKAPSAGFRIPAPRSIFNSPVIAK